MVSELDARVRDSDFLHVLGIKLGAVTKPSEILTGKVFSIVSLLFLIMFPVQGSLVRARYHMLIKKNGIFLHLRE